MTYHNQIIDIVYLVEKNEDVDFLSVNPKRLIEVALPVKEISAEKRSKHLVKAHERFPKVLGGLRFKVVYPMLPMDILGMYILLPRKI